MGTTIPVADEVAALSEESTLTCPSCHQTIALVSGKRLPSEGGTVRLRAHYAGVRQPRCTLSGASLRTVVYWRRKAA